MGFLHVVVSPLNYFLPFLFSMSASLSAYLSHKSTTSPVSDACQEFFKFSRGNLKILSPSVEREFITSYWVTRQDVAQEMESN